MLKSIRNKLGITQKEASKITGIPLRTYINYELDDTKQNSIKYKYILETLEYDVSYCLSHFSDTEEMLQKAIDFVKLRPNLAFVIVACVSKERFMKSHLKKRVLYVLHITKPKRHRFSRNLKAKSIPFSVRRVLVKTNLI